jgi:DNA-binding GntR family transcriptional regulator
VALRRNIAEAVRRAVVGGQLAPGTRINESRLSADLGVSRTPLREALFSLESLGILEADPPRGFFVTPLSAREIRELYPIGRALDLLAVRSAMRFPKTTLDRLEAINDRFRAARRRAERARILDREFHQTLISPSQNQRLHAMLDGVQTSMERYERLYMSDEHDVERSARQHDEIVRSLRRDDLEGALRVLGAQWDDSVQRLIMSLGEQP